jgi:hypothetical protein
MQKKHVEHRQFHLQSLAEAIVEKKNPSLVDPYRFEKKTKRTAHSIIRRERLKRMHKKINRQLHPANSVRGLARVDIAETPLGRDPLLSTFGYKADTLASDELVTQGKLPEDSLKDQLPEMIKLLQTLANFDPPAHSDINIDITKEQFQAIYSKLKESTSSSPSGRHIGHYKVAAKSDSLSNLHSKMMSIPLLAGFSPTRWRVIVDVMLEKSIGDPKIHRLRKIALQESDFNQCNRLAISRPLMYKLEDLGLISDMQYGSRPKKLCQSATLNKQLTFEILRYKNETAAFIKNDAVGCYDRIVNPLVLLMLWKLGVPQSAIQSLAQTWEHTLHHIKTHYGISEQTYSNSKEASLFGPGQGSTLGPFLWLLCFILIHDSINPTTPRVVLSSTDHTTNLQAMGESSVDDTNLGVTATQTGDSPTSITQTNTGTRVIHFLQHWRKNGNGFSIAQGVH